MEGKPPVVWAIDEEHSVYYFFPRDCPRVIFSWSQGVSAEDEKLFFSHTGAKTIIAVEAAWLDRIRNTTIYRYSFREDGFVLTDATAGYYTSRKTVIPVCVEPMGDLLGEIVSKGVELRIVPNLYPLRNAIVSSTITDFSIIRFRNAVNRENF
jgi:hypothetical protein